MPCQDISFAHGNSVGEVGRHPFVRAAGWDLNLAPLIGMWLCTSGCMLEKQRSLVLVTHNMLQAQKVPSLVDLQDHAPTLQFILISLHKLWCRVPK